MTYKDKIITFLSKWKFQNLGKYGPGIIILTIIAYSYEGSLDIYFSGDIWSELLACIEPSNRFWKEFIVADLVQFRPLVSFVQSTFFKNFGLNPFPYHLLVVTLHAVNSIYVYYMAKFLSGDRVVGLGSALLYGTFYIHAEPLFNLSFAHEVFWVFFALSSLLGFLFYLESKERRYFWLSLFTFVLSGLCKETALVLPGVIAFLSCLHSGKAFSINNFEIRCAAKGIKPVIPFFAVLMVYVTYLKFFTLSLDTNLYGGYDFMPSFKHKLDTAKLITNLSLYPIAGKYVWLKPGVYYLWGCIIVFLLLFKKHRFIALFLLVAGTIFIIPPMSIEVCHARFTYMPSAFFMTLVCLMLRNFLKEITHRLHFSEFLEIAVFIVVVLLICNHNIGFVKDVENIYRTAGELSESNLRDLVEIIQRSPHKRTICALNLPSVVEVNGKVVGGPVQVWMGVSDVFTALAVYCTHQGPNALIKPRYDRRRPHFEYEDGLDVSVSEYLVDFGLPQFQSTIHDNLPLLSPEDFNKITLNSENMVVLFNPFTKRLIDVSGLSFEETRETILENSQ